MMNGNNKATIYLQQRNTRWIESRTTQECAFVREGILSELVVFGDTLFANVAGPKDTEDTLYKVLSALEK